MFTEQEKKQETALSTASSELEQLISGAMKKIGGKRENDICRFLPMVSGGYMHHFTLRKMKHQLPEKLAEMIRQYIINVDRPLNVKPKQRAARGSRKKKDQVVLAGADLDLLISLARGAGNKELARKLLPQKDLKTVKRELCSSIRKGVVDHNLWSAFVEMVSAP